MKNLLLSKAKNGMLFFLIISCLTFSKCAKEDPLPEFYFQCKVDGVLYEPDNCANCIGREIIGDTTLILGGNRGFKTLGVGIKDNSGIKVRQYILNEIIGRRGDYKFSTSPNDRYYTDSTHTGQLNITSLDKNSKIIEGNFQFEAFNVIQNKVVRITEGKFRLNYRYY